MLELITKFLLDPKGYQEGAKIVEATTRHITGVIDGLTSGIMSGLHSALSMAFNPIAALAGGAGLIALGTSAVNAAISFDTIERSLTAVTQSAERAKSILKFDDQLAGPSIFTSEDLAAASLHLEAFKLQTEEFLPVAEKVATVFGSNKAALDSYVEALGYLKNGRFGEGFESFTRAGLSREDFEGQGLTFDKGGSYTGSAEDALNAVEKLVNERFGKLSQEMANGPAAKLASIWDAIGRAARQAGGAILSVLVPAAERVGNFIGYLVDSGALEAAFNGIARLFDGQSIGDGLVRAISYLVAIIQELPSIFIVVRAAAGSFFDYVKDNLKTVGAIFFAAFAFGPILQGLELLILAITRVRQATSFAAIAAEVFQAALSGGKALLTTLGAAAAAYAAGLAAMNVLDNAANSAMDNGPMRQLSGEWDRIDQRAKGFAGGFSASQGPTGTAKGILDVVTQTLGSPTRQIAEHTRRTAAATEKLTDLKDSILGGSVVGKGATSAVELDKVLGTNRGGGDEVDQIGSLIRRYVERTTGGLATANAMQDRGRR